MKFTFFVAVMCTASAYDFSAVAPSGQTLYYNISGGNVSVTSQNRSEPFYTTYPTGALTIPDTVTYNGTTYSVKSIGWYAFDHCSGLTSVTIPNSVTSIGTKAFAYCSGLTSVTIGNSVTSIDYAAFESCSGLTSVTIPNSVTSIGEFAFTYCTGLTSVTIGNSVTTIRANAFSVCSGLTSVTIGSSVTSIGDGAFRYCDVLTSVVCKGSTPPSGHGGIPTDATITIPCGTTNAYTASWGSRFTYQEAFLYELNVASSDGTQGTATVQQHPLCSDSAAILIATPATGYRFDHWSNGSTDNPYTLTVTNDTTLVAYFAIVGGGTDGISNIKNNDISVYVAEGRIHVTLDGQTTDEFSVYDVMGHRAAHVIASDKSPVLPAGVYIVKVGTLPARKVVVTR